MMLASTFAVNVARWSDDRNITTGSTPARQFLKLMEEFKETCEAIECHDVADTMDGIGDTLVVLAIILHQTGQNFHAPFQKGLDMRAAHAGLIDDPMIVLGSSLGEIAVGIAKESPITIKEGCSGVVKGLKMLCDAAAIDINDCMSEAWEAIKDRRGVLVGGVFVKESDLPGPVS